MTVAQPVHLDASAPPSKKQKTQEDTTKESQKESGRPSNLSLAPVDHFSEHFMDPDVDNLRVEYMNALIYPQLLLEEFPLTMTGKRTVMNARRGAAEIIHGNDDRLVVIVGPCSIHDTQAAREYANRLKVEADRLKDDLLIIMRVYFEKPRTTVGWKGLINDPGVDETYKVNSGLRSARKLLQDLTHMGMPVGCEFLDTMTPQYIADLVSWAAIGARTTECQLHRELSSALSMPVGFKNSTSGDVDVAVDAVVSAAHRHCFFSINKQGTASIVHSKGNPDCHIILRGGKTGPNYSQEHVEKAAEKCGKKISARGVIVDVSHGNSSKDFSRQPVVLKEIIDQQIVEGSNHVAGVMIESNLFEGAQKVPPAEPNPKSEVSTSEPGPAPDFSGSKVESKTQSQLRYGVSITDGCVSWMTTVSMLQDLADGVKARRELRRRTSKK